MKFGNIYLAGTHFAGWRFGKAIELTGRQAHMKQQSCIGTRKAHRVHSSRNMESFPRHSPLQIPCECHKDSMESTSDAVEPRTQSVEYTEGGNRRILSNCKDQHATGSLQAAREMTAATLQVTSFSLEKTIVFHSPNISNSNDTTRRRIRRRRRRKFETIPQPSWVWVAVQYPACFRKKNTSTARQFAPKINPYKKKKRPNRVLPLSNREYATYPPLKNAWLRKATVARKDARPSKQKNVHKSHSVNTDCGLLVKNVSPSPLSFVFPFPLYHQAGAISKSA